MNKTASILDVFFIVLIFFSMAVGLFIVYFGYDSVVDQALNNTAFNTTNVVSVVTDSQTNVGDRLDYVLFAVFMGMLIALIITSFFVSFHPIFIFIFTLVDIIIVIVASILSFVWNEVVAQSIFGSFVTDKFPITNHIISNYPLYASIAAIISLAIMYAKPYLAGEQ